ncbi:(2Fe-2S)-binding protein [Halobacteriales archaeon QS_6_71_20]|nr:MAG: (2Fe-2S)-binding protein [Halobacteriales archaeon QS_6_71_20]
MDDPVRVTVETDDGTERETVYDSEGEIDADGATFRFDVDEGRADGADADAAVDGDDTETDPLFVASLSDVPTDTTIRRTAMRPDGRRGVEFVLRRDADAAEVFAWRNSCPHRPEVPLDTGRGARVEDGEIVCHEHGARFECGDGLCTWGPCVGEELDPVGVAVRDGAVYLDDDRFASVRPR